MRRLERNGHKGMLLLHDSHPWTAAMLPLLLAKLKADGYRIVHMVPGPGTGPTSPAPPGWTSETERVISARRPRLDRHAAHGPDRPMQIKPAPNG